jgi:type II secretory pathway pseudopilin PulG
VSKRAKLLVLSSALALALLSLTGLVMLIWPFVSSSDINEQIEALRKHGLPTSEHDLRATIPDSRNGALLFEQAFKAMPDQQIGMRPLYMFPREGGRNEPDSWDSVKPLLGKYEKALALASKAATKPECRFTNTSDSRSGRRRNHLSGMRDLTRAAYARAMVSARDGKMDLAVRDILLIIHCANALREEPLVSALTVRVSLLRTASRAIEGCASYGQISASECRTLYDALSGLDLQRDLGQALEGERANTLSMFARSEKEGLSWLMTDSPDVEAGQRRISKTAAGKRLGGIIVRLDKRYYLNTMAEQMRLARLPYRTIRQRGLDKDPVQSAPKFAVLSTIALPVVQRAVQARDFGTASVAACRVLLALEAYHARFGAYPASLEEIRTKLNWQIERDPFSGRDFVYKPQANGYLLYSVGPNLEDDAGQNPDSTPSWQSRPRRPSDNRPRSGWHPHGFRDGWREDGDIVWRVERRPLPNSSAKKLER